MVTIAVTRLEYNKSEHVFREAEKDGFNCIPVQGDEAPFAEAVRLHGARHAIVGVVQYTGALYDALPRGGVIARYGVGYDALDLKQAAQKGIICVNTPGVLEEAVAEYTMALILSAARCLPGLNMEVRSGGWKPMVGTELCRKRLAVIGCGQIGRSVAKKASAGFGMEVWGCKTTLAGAEELKRDYGFKEIVLDFEEAVDNADFVSLHIPSTKATRGFINGGSISAIPSKAWLINTARGAVVDENALYDALKSGALRGAALDVYENEPYQPLDPGRDLRNLPNVIMTPHVASSTVEACERVAERALRNIRMAENGEFETMDILNPEALHNLE